MPILEHIPVKSLVGIVLDYWIDVRPIMHNVLCDINTFQFRHDPSTYLDYRKCLRDRIIDLVGDDSILLSLLANYPYKDAEYLCEQYYNICGLCDNVNKQEHLSYNVDGSVTQTCQRCNHVINIKKLGSLQIRPHLIARNTRVLIRW